LRSEKNFLEKIVQKEVVSLRRRRYVDKRALAAALLARVQRGDAARDWLRFRSDLDSRLGNDERRCIAGAVARSFSAHLGRDPRREAALPNVTAAVQRRDAIAMLLREPGAHGALEQV